MNICHRRKSNAVISGKRGRKARDDLFSVSNGVLYPVNIVFDLLGVLGTDNIAGTAEDTVVWKLFAEFPPRISPRYSINTLWERYRLRSPETT